MKPFTATQLESALNTLACIDTLPDAEQREIMANDHGVDAHGLDLLRRIRAYETANGITLEFADKHQPRPRAKTKRI